jgi:hypothetical protein
MRILMSARRGWCDIASDAYGKQDGALDDKAIAVLRSREPIEKAFGRVVDESGSC